MNDNGQLHVSDLLITFTVTTLMDYGRLTYMRHHGVFIKRTLHKIALYKAAKPKRELNYH